MVAPPIGTVQHPGPHRLVAQDTALSRRRRGFESRWGCYSSSQSAAGRWLVEPASRSNVQRSRRYHLTAREAVEHAKSALTPFAAGYGTRNSWCDSRRAPSQRPLADLLDRRPSQEHAWCFSGYFRRRRRHHTRLAHYEAHVERLEAHIVRLESAIERLRPDWFRRGVAAPWHRVP